VAFAAACVVSFALDLLIEHWAEQDSRTSSLVTPILALDGVYQRLLLAPRAASPRYTALVEINSQREPGVPSLNNVCAQRVFLASLLRRLADSKPSVIGVDKFFLRDGCTDRPEATDALVSAFEALRAQDVRLVVGARIQCDDDGQDCRFDPALPYVQIHPELQAVLNINRDNRRLPLRWSALSEGNRVSMNTFALRLAQIHEPDLAEREQRLQTFIDAGAEMAPYIGFVKKAEFPLFPAGELLCGTRVLESKDWTACEAIDIPASVSNRLRSRILIVGESHPDVDRHRSVIGRNIEGYVLQANYVEALLDSRYYRPASAIWKYVFTFVWLAAFELIFIVFIKRYGLLALSAAGVFAVTYLFLFLLLVHFNIYLNPTVAGILALAFRVTDLAFHPVKRMAEETLHA
jgi:CHASE2 domain-containing sensor protein